MDLKRTERKPAKRSWVAEFFSDNGALPRTLITLAIIIIATWYAAVAWGVKEAMIAVPAALLLLDLFLTIIKSLFTARSRKRGSGSSSR